MNSFNNQKPAGRFIDWNISIPPPDVRQIKILLLTTTGIPVQGFWSGYHGEYFVGWANIDTTQTNNQATN